MISDKEMRKRIEDMSPQELLKASETFEALFDLVHQHDDNSIENTNPDYYKDELYLDEDFRMLAKTYPADVSAIGVTTLIDYVEALEAELAALKSERRWIPVSEKLPELHRPVLCRSIFKYVVMYSLANENGHYWYNQNGWVYSFDSVTHWTPLPEPPPEAK